MAKMDTIDALAVAVLTNLINNTDLSSESMKCCELYDDEGDVRGWYAAMTNTSNNIDCGGRNIFVRAYAEIPVNCDKYVGEVEILTPNRMGCRFESVKVTVTGSLYEGNSCIHLKSEIDINGECIIDDIEERYDIYKRLLITML